MPKRLTDISIRNLRPGPTRREVPDGNGLYVVVQSSGKKRFAFRYRFNGKPKKYTLPAGLALAAARRIAADAAYEVAQGIDPAERKKAAKVEAMEAAANTVAAVCANWLQREGKKLRTADQRASIFKRLIYPAFGERPLDSIRRSDIVRMLDRIEDKSGQRMADVTLATLRRVFNWYALRNDKFLSPFVAGMRRQNPAEHRRDHILSDDELRAIWKATADGAPYSAIVRFGLLTSARRSEAVWLRRQEIDADGIWTLPAERSKTKVDVVRPLSKAARAILAAQPQIGDCPYVFTRNGVTPVGSLSILKRKLEAASSTTGWRFHDLRRTARSLLSRAGINHDIAERCLGHAMPTIRATYDRHKYVEEMRHAFEALSKLIENITRRPEGKVVLLAR
jgi:integrase